MEISEPRRNQIFKKPLNYFQMIRLIFFSIFLFFSTINVSQQNQKINDTISLDAVSLQALKIPLQEKKSMYPVSKLSFKNYQNLTPQLNLSEYLENVPGLVILNNNNYAQDARISIRGFGSRANFGVRGIKIFVDGIPETSPDGQSQTDNINLEIIEDIEVYRGNNSSLFGSSSGGVISINTVENFEKDFVNIGYSSGSFNTSKKQGTIGLINGNQKMIFFLSNTKSNGFRSHSGYENSNLNFKYIKELNPNNKLKIIANFLNSPDALDAGGLNLEEVQSNRSQARARNVQYDAREKVKQYKIGVNLSSIIRKLELTNSIYYNKRLFDGKLPFSYGGIVDLERIFWGYNLNANIKAGLNYDFGLSYNNQSDDRQRFMNDSGLKKDQVMGQNENYDNISLYFFGSKSIKKLNFSTGARLEKNSISLDNYFGSSDGKIKKINSFNPSLNISYEFDKIDFFTNFSTGYETPTLNELSATSSQSGFNDDLNSIKSTTFEFGVANFDKDSKLNFSLRLFNILTKNEITPYQTSTGLVLYNNAGKTIKKGLELELKTTIFKNLNINYTLTSGSYKFDSFKFLENDYSKNYMPGIPKSNQNLKFSYSNNKNLNIIFSLKSVGKIYADNANNTEIAGYNSIGFKMSKDLTLFQQNVTPFISIENLLNEDYFDNIRINAFGSRFYEPASGINFVCGLKLQL